MIFTTLDALMESQETIENALKHWQGRHPEFKYHTQIVISKKAYKLEITVYATEVDQRLN